MDTPPMKPGYKTTEFWLSAAAVLLSTLFAAGVIPAGSNVERAAIIVASVLGSAGYAVSRGIAKQAVVGVLLACLLSSGCASYTAQQALTCVRGTLPLARPALAIAKDCKAARSDSDAILQCVDDSIDGGLQTLAAVEACVPVAPAVPAKP